MDAAGLARARAHQVPQDRPALERRAGRAQGLLRAVDRQLPAALPAARRRDRDGRGRGAAGAPGHPSRPARDRSRDRPVARDLGARQRRAAQRGRLQSLRPHRPLHLAVPGRHRRAVRRLRGHVGPRTPRARAAQRAQRAPHVAALPDQPAGHDRPLDHRGLRGDRPTRAVPGRPRPAGARCPGRHGVPAPDHELLPSHGHRRARALDPRGVHLERPHLAGRRAHGDHHLDGPGRRA